MPKTSQTPVKQGTPATIHLNNGEYLSSKIASLPAGKIDKRYPGIGATTLEIEDPSRNSIIVFPTRALAATKAKAKNIHYYGSAYQGVNVSTVSKIIEDIESGVLTKIAIVADSLVTVYAQLKEYLYAHDFFIVLDEIDSFQTESSYRPKLEECIDIYFDFPAERRCLVSATLEQFSDRRLMAEPLTVIAIDNYEKLEIKAINATKSVLKVAAEEIIRAYEPGKKVFVAFNSIDGILKLLEILPDTLAQVSGALCSTDSQSRFKSHQISRLEDGILQHQITFLTSAFFVGVDVLEPQETVHAIILADTNIPVSLVSESKIRQIFGRIRYSAATYTIILNCTERPYQPINIYRESLSKRQDAYEQVLDAIHGSFDQVGLHDEGREIETIMLDTCRVDNVCLLRRANNKVILSRSNFDYLIIRYTALKKLYSDFKNTVKNLNNNFKVHQEARHSELSDLERNAIAKVEALIQDQELANMMHILENSITDPLLAKGKANRILTEIFKAASNTIDPMKLRAIITALPIRSAKVLNMVLFQVKVFSQEENSLLWKHLDLHFKIGGSYTAKQIWHNLNSITKAIGYDNPLVKFQTQIQAVQHFKMIYVTKKKLNKHAGTYEFQIISTLRTSFNI